MDESQYESDMAKSGSFACLPKQAITNIFECILSCVIFAATIYLILSFLGFVKLAQVDSLLHLIGYISLIILFSAPIGLYGCAKGSYKALFVFFILSSYHLYALLVYIYLSFQPQLSSSSANSTTSQTGVQKANSTSDSSLIKPIAELSLHHVTTFSYTVAVTLTLLMTSCKIISVTKEIEPKRVIVVDNNPLD